MGGASNIIVPAFDPDAVLDLIAERRITCAIAVPTMLAALVERQAADPRDVSSLRWLSHGASPVALEVLRRAAELFGCELIHLYGATELSPLATVFRHEEQWLDGPRAKSCGPPSPGVDLRIVDPDGRPVDAGGVGEVVVKGPNVMAGYWNKPEQTAAAMLDGGWYRTGDLGHLDEDGYLYLVDRAKDMIITGGENVYAPRSRTPSTPTRRCSRRRRSASRRALGGGGARRRRAAPVPTPLTPRALIDHCRPLIAGYKPRQSISSQSRPAPQSGPGKVLKRTLCAPDWDGHRRQIH